MKKKEFNKSKCRLIVALDVPSLKLAHHIVKLLRPEVEYFKIGSELFTYSGPEAIQMVKIEGGRVFLDLKYLDIPRTVAQSCVAAASWGADMITVHLAGGKEMLDWAITSITAKNRKNTHILGVSVLTSMVDKDLTDLGINESIESHVNRLVSLAKSCKLHGIVASGREAKLVRKIFPAGIMVIPGVRQNKKISDDQRRVVTVEDAKKAGADFVVMGRPILESDSPRETALKIIEKLNT